MNRENEYSWRISMEFLEETAALLTIKECDLRADTLEQCGASIDRGIHIGGAYSALPPLTALYYSGLMKYDLQNPASTDQDIFILSKGHAIAALASVYADIGYIEKKHLKGSRGYGALIKGHPGPVIPGVPVATGPLGHGISLSAGYALKRKEEKNGNVYCLVGDGELQEGSCWEGIMFAGDRKLNNLCVIVDKNDGQSDDTSKLLIRMDNMRERFEAFGFRVLDASGDDMASILSALDAFCQVPQSPRPTAIICQSNKGIGGYGALTTKHKVNFTKEDLEREMKLLSNGRRQFLKALLKFDGSRIKELAGNLGYDCLETGGRITELVSRPAVVSVRHPPQRNKAIACDRSRLPLIEDGKEYAAHEIIRKTMSVLAEDPRIFTVDSDLSNASGLFEGTLATNRLHAINAGISECNMMCMAEALATEGANVWVSTFGPFFDWRAFRRIAVGFQERKEIIEEGSGWLSEGYNADITCVATAANLDTGVNGATHMSNDDICFFDQLAHVHIIDACCPRQLLSILEWIAAGNRGLVYLRIMRNKSKVLYGKDFVFEFGKGYFLRKHQDSKAVIVSSGHGVLEAIQAADILEKEHDCAVSVVDMPTFDGELCETLVKSGMLVLFAEQNNGALLNRFGRYALLKGIELDCSRILNLNALDETKKLRFIQSGTYEELVKALNLRSDDIVEAIRKRL
jgi:transketolase